LGLLTLRLGWLGLKACGSPLKLSPAGGLCLPAGKHTGILTIFQTLINKKMDKKQLFFGCHFSY